MVYFGFPVPIIVALMFSEVKNVKVRTITQILSYLPFLINFCYYRINLFNVFAVMMLPQCWYTRIFLILWNRNDSFRNTIMANPKFFRPIYIISDIWQEQVVANCLLCSNYVNSRLIMKLLKSMVLLN